LKNIEKSIFGQFNQQGKIYGSKGDIDLNVFRGKIEDWQKLISEYSRIN
jgi:GH25 family lysozyme M1 (1,4-beta-N-acetylmuramidase)